MVSKPHRLNLKGFYPAASEKFLTTHSEQWKTNQKIWFCLDFDTIDYQEAWTLQGNLVAARKDRILETDVVLFLEHPCVFTLGRRGGQECLLASQNFLEKSGIQLIQVERGGNITFHGPGQLVVYPIIDLQNARLKVVDYVRGLEEVMIRTAQSWSIPAERNPINRGIWVGNNKLGSIGIAVRKGVSFHGLALNVNIDLTPFTWIRPCGLEGIKMTSMKQELSQELSMFQVKDKLKEHFASVFGVEFNSKSLAQLQKILKN